MQCKKYKFKTCQGKQVVAVCCIASNAMRSIPAVFPVNVELSRVTAEPSAVYAAPPVVLALFWLNCELMMDKLEPDVYIAPPL